MKIYDQHLHTFLSSDSEEKFENYLQKAQEFGLTHFVSTEHLDLSCIALGKDDLPDLALQKSICQNLQRKYPIQILRGIELGYKFSRLKDIEHIVATQDFDVIIMSVHEDEYAECASPAFLHDKSPDEAYAAYLKLYIHMLNHCSCYDIVGHIDFLLRYMAPVCLEKHKNKLCELFQLVIHKGKCLEFNTRFLYRHNESHGLNYLFSLYFACGGKKVSLGSDAHTTQDYLASFTEAAQMLRDIGFSHISTFQKRKETPISL